VKKLVANASDAEQVNLGKAKIKNARQEHLDRLRAVLATREGQEVLWAFITAGKYFDFMPGPGSIETLNFQEGQRALAGRIATDVGEASPEALHAMLQRHFEAQQERNK
jgi:hypothetical protein